MCVCVQDACVRQANRCVRTAKLVALQLHLLDRDLDLRIVNLRPPDLPAAIMALPRCYQVSLGGLKAPRRSGVGQQVTSAVVSQVFVVSEAYGYSPDWAGVLYQKVVLSGDFAYLEELKRRRPLTSSLFEDIFKK